MTIFTFGGNMNYNEELPLNKDDISVLVAIFNGLLSTIKHISVTKATKYIQTIPLVCRLHYNSLENRRIKRNNEKKLHPIIPHRGEIYNAYIAEGVGSELCGNHLVLIIQNQKGNMYSEKVNILPIEGNGNRINPNYQLSLTNNDMENGHLDKDPSRIIVTDITTVNKARLDRRIGKIKPECMAKIERLIRQQLSL